MNFVPIKLTFMDELFFGCGVELLETPFNIKLYSYFTVMLTRFPSTTDVEDWLIKYGDIKFYEIFRLTKNTFNRLLCEIVNKDEAGVVYKKYRGGNTPVPPEKSLLIFLFYMSHQDTLVSIGDRFKVAKSTVMNIVNCVLYVMNYKLKNKYIFWPRSEEEYQHVLSGFKKYPGTIGAIDGCHIRVTVENEQHDSYADRYMNHSINLMAICNADRIFTYIFVGFPGSAHDSRVFSNSLLFKKISRYGANKYFLDVDRYHIIGDSAFPVQRWLMTPYKKSRELTRREKKHNFYLSSDRVVIENAFGLLKNRWSRLLYIKSYNICKSIEIIVAACILHNFCLLGDDDWEYVNEDANEGEEQMGRQENRLGQEKRDRIAQSIFLLQ